MIGDIYFCGENLQNHSELIIMSDLACTGHIHCQLIIGGWWKWNGRLRKLNLQTVDGGLANGNNWVRKTRKVVISGLAYLHNGPPNEKSIGCSNRLKNWSTCLFPLDWQRTDVKANQTHWKITQPKMRRKVGKTPKKEDPPADCVFDVSPCPRPPPQKAHKYTIEEKKFRMDSTSTSK